MSPSKDPASNTAAESNLIARAQQSEEAAFAALYRLHKRRVYSLCLCMTGDAAEAEELSEEAFIQLFRKIGTFRGELAFAAWLQRLAMSVIFLHFGERETHTSSHDGGLSSDQALIGREGGGLKGVESIGRHALMNAITELPLRLRAVFALHDVEGYGHSDVASIMACSIADSKSQLLRARLRLRDLLRRNQDTSETVYALPARHRPLSS